MSETVATRPKRERLFLNADGRTFTARRYKAIRAALLARLPAPHTPYQVAMVESAASLQLRLEVERNKLAEGEFVDPSTLVKLTGGLRRHLRDLALSEDEDAS